LQYGREGYRPLPPMSIGTIAFPGRGAARSAALQTRDRHETEIFCDPGSAVHHFVLHRIRETV
jgi:hypothetical protein